jgi:hypothetical protein
MGNFSWNSLLIWNQTVYRCLYRTVSRPIWVHSTPHIRFIWCYFKHYLPLKSYVSQVVASTSVFSFLIFPVSDISPVRKTGNAAKAEQPAVTNLHLCVSTLGLGARIAESIWLPEAWVGNLRPSQPSYTACRMIWELAYGKRARVFGYSEILVQIQTHYLRVRTNHRKNILIKQKLCTLHV